jgi:hypothetical protein
MEKLYTAQYRRHVENGDDSMNAKLRIIEEGCPVDLAERIAADDDESCPGCGCQPGDGRTLGCTDPDGCGFGPEE